MPHERRNRNVSLRFGNPIFLSAAVADGTLIGVLAVGYWGEAEIEATAQFEATPTSDLLTGFPVRSAFQERFTLLRVCCRAAWANSSGQCVGRYRHS